MANQLPQVCKDNMLLNLVNIICPRCQERFKLIMLIEELLWTGGCCVSSLLVQLYKYFQVSNQIFLKRNQNNFIYDYHLWGKCLFVY